MPTVSTWSGVGVSMESARATAKVITAITKANPANASSSAHGYVNGDLLLLDITSGMVQLDERVVRVANSLTGTFDCEGIDSTLFDTFVSGNAYKLTLGTAFNVFTTVSGEGGDFDFIDTTTIHVNSKSQMPGASNPPVFTFDAIWDPADAGLIAAKAASDAKALKCFGLTWPSGRKVYFEGYIACSMVPNGSAQDKVTTKVVITAAAALTPYAT